MAWQRKVLRVNLTTGACTPEPLNMQWAREYIGQRGRIDTDDRPDRGDTLGSDKGSA